MGVVVLGQVLRLVLVAALVAPVFSFVLAEPLDDVSAMILRDKGSFLADFACVLVHVAFGGGGVAGGSFGSWRRCGGGFLESIRLFGECSGMLRFGGCCGAGSL